MVCTKLVVRSLVVSLICGKRFALISRYWFSIPGITCLTLPTRHPSMLYPSILHNDPKSQQRLDSCVLAEEQCTSSRQDWLLLGEQIAKNIFHPLPELEVLVRIQD